MIHDYQRKLFGGMGNSMFKEAYLYAQMKEGLIPDVYVQDEKYFKKYENDIKAMYGEGIGFLPYVSIHVRRGDYLTSGKNFYVDLCSTGYYERAIELFPDKKFLLFCKDGQGEEQDKKDEEWCMNYFTPLLGDRFQFMSSNSGVDDFNLMASCSAGNIIANSSFSYWAAWLNPNHAKVVVTPKEWFTDGKERTVCPKEWIRI